MDGQTMLFGDGSQKAVIHFSVRTDRERIACFADEVLAQQKDRVFSIRRSDDPRAVTCPVCQETDEFKKKMTDIQTAMRSGKACV